MNFFSKFSTETQVGLLIVAGFGLIVYSSLLVTGWKADESQSYEIHAYFENVSGIVESTAVRIAGIKVGSVKEIKLEYGKAKITMAIFRKYSVYDNASASIRSLGILGDKYIELTQGTSTYPKLVDQDEVKLVLNNNNLDAVITSLTGILSDLKGVTHALNTSMGGEEGAGKFNRILANTEQLTNQLKEAMVKTNSRIDSILVNFENFTSNINRITVENREGIRQGIEDFQATSRGLREIITENREDLRQVIANFESFSKSLKTDGPEITGQLKGILKENRQALKNTLTDLEETSAKLNKAMENINSSAKNVASVTKKIDDGEGTLGKLVNDERTVESINQTLDGVNELLGQANRSKLDMGVRLEYLSESFNDKNTKGYMNLIYKPRPDHYYILGINSSPRGKQSETRTQTQTGSGGTVTQTTEEKIENKDEFLLSLQIAQKYYDTRFRIGFFENSVGIGVDQYFGKKEQFRLFGEIYNFSRKDEGALLKVGADYYLLPHFYLTAGGNDIINEQEQYKSYFLGFGLNFNEDNLKLLAGSLPLPGL